MSSLTSKNLLRRILALLLCLGLSAEAKGDDDRVLALRSPDGTSSLRFVGLVQVQHAAEWIDEAPSSGTLLLNRARAGATGSVFTEDLRYLLVADFGRDEARLLYASVDYTLVPGALSVRAGQFKRPFSRSFLTSSSQLSMIDRPLPVSAFGDDADVGFMVHNGDSRPFEYAVGVFSGSAPGAEPDPVHPLVGMRLAGKTGGLLGYAESDLEGGAPRLGVGLAVAFDLETDAGLPTRGVVDLAFKAHGFALSSATYVSARQDGTAPSDRHVDAVGHATQVGYVIAEQIEPVVRYAFLLPRDGEADTHDASAGVNVFLRGHALKLQGDVGVREVRAHPFGVRDDEKSRAVYVKSQLTVAL